MLHGMGAGLALFSHNFPALSQASVVYAIDLPGFGRSSRVTFRYRNHRVGGAVAN
jgi:pimeloyl-ACP methyl ester carboxylesterase